MEVFYRRPNGDRVRGWAIQNLRVIPPRWEVGGIPIEQVERITHREWLLGAREPEWEESAKAFTR